MRTILFASIALMAGSASVASSQQEAGVAQVRRLDSLWARMYAKHDTALALQLYAADLVFTSANGAQKTRAQELDDVRSNPNLTMEYFRTSPSQVTVGDSTATVTGIAEWKFVWGGQTREMRRSYDITYARGGPLGWHIRAVRMGQPAR